METVNWKVEGMSCTGCAQTIDGFLQKKGMQQVRVSLTGGEVSFTPGETFSDKELKNGLEALGYHVADENVGVAGKKPLNKFLKYLIICLPFTLLLLLHMGSSRAPLHWLMNGWVQLALCLPVYITGMLYFGKSAIKSIQLGSPNMNVLVAMGATAAFAYSLAGTLLQLGEGFLFYETAAAIITLVFLGNYIEERSIRSTQKVLDSLVSTQEGTANMIAFDDQHQEIVFPVNSRQLRSGDLILVKSGEQVPADCKILWGDAQVNESIITGESMPVHKKEKDSLIGGSLLSEGTIKAQVTAAYKDSILSGIVNLVKRAQTDKPPIQLLADRISAVFVPAVIGVSLLTFFINYFLLQAFGPSLMRAIAVLVIACPCAMGLATPAAIAVGLGRAARHGILLRSPDSLELFRNIRQIVFDKTGTLTTGRFTISSWAITDHEWDEKDFKRIVFSLEKYSNHPIAKAISETWKIKGEARWEKVTEIKGLGVKAWNAAGDEFAAGSYTLLNDPASDDQHNVYIQKNGKLLGWIDLNDEIRPEAFEVIKYFREKGIKTILLSGDRLEKCKAVASALQLDEVLGEQTPEQKLAQVDRLNREYPTAMVGDGINDAPALAKASIGISMSDASQIALQTADVVLMNDGLRKLPLAMSLGKQTFLTIKQNLFWAFIYNVFAIPIAAFGLLNPAIGAFAMAMSDVVLLINSSRLFVKKLL